ncbi:hypothetical protein HUJ04_005014 [Dendroctonus ponderosae]
MSERSSISEKVAECGKFDTQEKNMNEFRKRWQLWAKILELILCALCIGLVMEPAKRGDLARIHLAHFALIFPTFIGYSLIVSVFLVAKAISGDTIPYRTGFMLSLLGSCFFFTCAVLLILDRKKNYFLDEFFYEPRPYILKLLTASTGLSFITSILFGVEAFYIFKFREDF